MKLRDKLGNLLDRGHRRDGLRIDVSNLSGSTTDNASPSPSKARSGRFSRTPRKLTKTPRSKSVGPRGGWSSPASRSTVSNPFTNVVDDNNILAPESTANLSDTEVQGHQPLPSSPSSAPSQSQSSPVSPDENKATLNDELKPRIIRHITAPAWDQPATPKIKTTPTVIPATHTPRFQNTGSLRRKKPPPIATNAQTSPRNPLSEVGTAAADPGRIENPGKVMPLVRTHSDKQPVVKTVATVARPVAALASVKRIELAPEPDDDPAEDFSFSSDWNDMSASFGDQLVDKPHSPPKQTAKKRPPILRDFDVVSEQEEHQIFGEDGALHVNGFTISGGGITAAPSGLQRQRSNGSSIEGVPRSIRSNVLVNSLDELRIIKHVGAGASGRVNLSLHVPSGKQMAVKVVNVYDEEKRNQLLKELQTLTSYVSRFLVRFCGAFYDGKGAVHIILEFMDCGALADLISNHGPVPEDVTNHIAVNCLHGLRFLHKSRVLHRDLKTANILLSRELGRAKLSDFGLAREVNAGVSKADTFVGTLAYMSPERLHGSAYTYASDIWGLGISIAECLLGRYPFDKPQSYFDYIAVTTTTENVLPRGRFSPACEDFVRRCTAVDPHKRPDCDELLEHRWIKESERDGAVFARWLDDITVARNSASMKKAGGGAA